MPLWVSAPDVGDPTERGLVHRGVLDVVQTLCLREPRGEPSAASSTRPLVSAMRASEVVARATPRSSPTSRYRAIDVADVGLLERTILALDERHVVQVEQGVDQAALVVRCAGQGDLLVVPAPGAALSACQ